MPIRIGKHVVIPTMQRFESKKELNPLDISMLTIKQIVFTLLYIDINCAFYECECGRANIPSFSTQWNAVIPSEIEEEMKLHVRLNH